MPGLWSLGWSGKREGGREAWAGTKPSLAAAASSFGSTASCDFAPRKSYNRENSSFHICASLGVLILLWIGWVIVLNQIHFGHFGRLEWDELMWLEVIFFFAVLKKMALNYKSGKEPHFKNYSESNFRSNRVLLITFILLLLLLLLF